MKSQGRSKPTMEGQGKELWGLSGLTLLIQREQGSGQREGIKLSGDSMRFNLSVTGSTPGRAGKL